MKILIFGAGAVGAYYGGRLSQAGAEVSVCCRSDFDEVSRNGFEISSIKGDFIFKPVQVIRSAAEYQGDADLIIAASKVLPEIDVVSMIRDAVRPGTSVMLAQNGIAIENCVHDAFPANEVLRAVLYIGCTKVAHGKIAHTGGPGSITFGVFNGQKHSETAEKLRDLFSQTPCPVTLTDKIQYFCWKKLLWNIPFNSISVLGGGLLTGEMTDRGGLEHLCGKLMEEIIRVAASENIVLEDELISENIEYTRNFEPYASSMLADFRRNRPLEVDAIVGNTYRIALKNKIAVPYIETIYALLKSVDAKQREANSSK